MAKLRVLLRFQALSSGEKSERLGVSGRSKRGGERSQPPFDLYSDEFPKTCPRGEEKSRVLCSTLGRTLPAGWTPVGWGRIPWV